MIKMITKLRKLSASNMFALAVVISILPATSPKASTQGWTGSAAQRGSKTTSPKTESKPAAATKSTPSKRHSSARKSRTAARKTSGKKATAAAASTAATTQTATTNAAKASRERRVTDSTDGPASTTIASGPTAVAPKPGRCNPDKDERVDLSGNYTGVINYPAAGMMGDATLTVTGNRFTLSSGAKTQVGNITAVATCNYTAVAMMFGEWKTPQPGEPVLPPLPMLSLRAIKKGDQLTLKPSLSERREFLFEPVTKK